MNWKIGKLFSSDQCPEHFEDVENMSKQISDFGDLLHFVVETDGDGWHAQCQEIDGIITGGANPKPSDDEIQKGVREAIHTAFHIPITKRDIKKRIFNASDLQAVYERRVSNKGVASV